SGGPGSAPAAAPRRPAAGPGGAAPGWGPAGGAGRPARYAGGDRAGRQPGWRSRPPAPGTARARRRWPASAHPSSGPQGPATTADEQPVTTPHDQLPAPAGPQGPASTPEEQPVTTPLDQLPAPVVGLLRPAARGVPASRAGRAV